jgi:hypothetical protein
MTNKLPVVGKRYRLRNYKAEVINVDSEGVTYLQGDKEYWDFLDDFRDYFEELPEDKAETKPETKSHISVDFAKEGSDKTFYTFVKNAELSPEVKEAIIKAKRELNKDRFTSYLVLSDFLKIEAVLSNLLNALDKQFMSKEEDKIDTRQEHLDSIKVNETSESVDVKEEEVKEKDSIWKPVNELPKSGDHIYLKLNSQEILTGYYEDPYFFRLTRQTGTNNSRAELVTIHEQYIEAWCALTDYVNDYEKLKERVRKLEEKCGKS